MLVLKHFLHCVSDTDSTGVKHFLLLKRLSLTFFLYLLLLWGSKPHTLSAYQLSPYGNLYYVLTANSFLFSKLSTLVCSRSFLLNSIFYYRAQQSPRRKGFSPGALMSCFLSFPKWCPILRSSPVSVLVVWMYIRLWQIHSALFGNFSGTELNKSESDSKLMEPEWQLDANPISLDLFTHFLLRDSGV